MFAKLICVENTAFELLGDLVYPFLPFALFALLQSDKSVTCCVQHPVSMVRFLACTVLDDKDKRERKRERERERKKER
jgi:hypothetical protein